MNVIRVLDFENLLSQIPGILDMLVEQGFKPPIYSVIVSKNGSMHVGMYYDCGDGRILFEEFFKSGGVNDFYLPGNMMLTDSTGAGERILLEPDVKPKLTILPHKKAAKNKL